MSDDWSLKNKSNIKKSIIENYFKSDIETLRKKLIDDISKWARESGKYETGEVIEPIVIIQKRFGVND